MRLSNRMILSKHYWFISAVAVTFSPGLVMCQTQPVATVIPPGSAAYYQAPSGLVPMRGTFLMPLFQDTSASWLGVGRPKAIVDLPGKTATFGVAEFRPTFLLRGFSPDSGLYLVRESHKEDFRRLNMPVSRTISQWGHFKNGDLTEIEFDSLDPDVIRIRPRTDLKPGDYILVSDLESRYRAMRIGFEFHIMSPAPSSAAGTRPRS